MSHASRRVAGIILIVWPTVIYGGVNLLRLLIGDPAYMDNPLRQNLWRAGQLVRSFIPSAAILLPAAVFLSVLHADAREPNGFIYLAYLGALLLAIGVVALGVGLLRAPGSPEQS